MGIKKQNRNKGKISKEEVQRRGGSCEQYPAISFRYLTTNKGYNFDYFKDSTEKSNMLGELSRWISTITSNTYQHWLSKGKIHGCELLEFWNFEQMKPKQIDLSKDEKIYVFRFNNQEYRICGIRLEKCPTLYVVGFDFNHSAYKH